MRYLLIYFILSVAAGAGSKSIGEANPYDWVVDNAHYNPGARVEIKDAFLYHGFEVSMLMRDAKHEGSIIAVDFDGDVIRVDYEAPFSLVSYNMLYANLMTVPRKYRIYKITADVEIRPFPKSPHKGGGYGHSGSALGCIVVKRIYKLEEIKE